MANLKPDFPNIPKSKEVNLQSVAAELNSNPWLNTAFLTTFTANLLAFVQIKMQEHDIEGRYKVELLNVVGDLGIALGGLAMQKANLEAEMYRYQALANFVSFGLTMAAGSVQLAGIGGSTVANNMKEKASINNPITAPTVAGSKPIGGPLDGLVSGKKSIEPMDMGSKKTISGKSNSSERAVGSNESISPPISLNSKKSSLSENSSSNQSSGTSTLAQKGANTAKDEGFSEGYANSGSEAKSMRNGEGKIGAFNNLKNKMAIKGKRENIPLEAKGEAKVNDSSVKRAENIALAAKVAENLGESMVKGTGNLGTAADNIVQMVFTPLIGATEQQTQIMQAQKDIALQVLESASKDFQDAGSAIDSALQSLQKVQDETSKAHTLGRG